MCSPCPSLQYRSLVYLYVSLAYLCLITVSPLFISPCAALSPIKVRCRQGAEEHETNGRGERGGRRGGGRWRPRTSAQRRRRLKFSHSLPYSGRCRTVLLGRYLKMCTYRCEYCFYWELIIVLAKFFVMSVEFWLLLSLRWHYAFYSDLITWDILLTSGDCEGGAGSASCTAH